MEGDVLKPRDQVVSVLSVKSDKIFPDKVENIHYDKFAGRAEVTREDADAFARRYHPDSYEDFLLNNRLAPYPLIIDFESVFTGIEHSPAYDTLLKVIRNQEIATAEDKANLAAFLVIQLLRSHAVMNAGLEWHKEMGTTKVRASYQPQVVLVGCRRAVCCRHSVCLCVLVSFRRCGSRLPSL
jgi:hypothetical protein